MSFEIPYRDEKIKNAICFFAKEHQERTHKPLSQTFLYKYLAFLDFKSLDDTGRPVLGLTYRAMKMGPVPKEIYEVRDTLKNDCFIFISIGEDKYIIRPLGNPDLDYFSPYEIKEMNRLIEIFADHFVKTSDISEASHQEIKAWLVAWNKQPNSIIDYDLEFDDDILTRDKADLTFAEENYLMYKAMKKAC